MAMEKFFQWIEKYQEKLFQLMGRNMDKMLHFALRALIVLTLANLFELYDRDPVSVIIGAIVALCAGVVKEDRDKRTGGIFDKQDLLADILGTIYGVIIYLI